MPILLLWLPSGIRKTFRWRVALLSAGLALAGVVIGAQTLILGAIFAVRFALATGVLVYRIGDAVNKC